MCAGRLVSASEMRGATLLAITTVLIAIVAPGGGPGPGRTAPRDITALRERGSQLVDASGQRVRLLGFNNSGAEYACQEGWGIFDTPTGTMTSSIVAAMASVHVYSFNACSGVDCYNGAMRQVAVAVPLLIGEFGPDLTVAYSASLDQSCPSRYVGRTSFDSALLTWAYRYGVSWAAWSWNPWGDCWSLVQNFGGAPTSPYGTIVKSALARQAAAVDG